MGYLHIPNLYRFEGQFILLFKECYALEKIHGTSANLQWDNAELKFHAGGEKHERFISLFDVEKIKSKLIDLGYKDRSATIYGEAYGGKQQGMSETYGPNLKFIAFDVCLDENYWLNVPDSDNFCKALDIEFVHYAKISTDLKSIDVQRDAESVQAVRNGMGSGKKREGIVLRPLIEVIKSGGERIISKHKGDDFRETASPRVVDDPTKLKVLEDANKIANEWVTLTRLEHVLDKITDHSMEKIPIILNAMVEDIFREGNGEIIENDAVKKSIRAKTVSMYKGYLNSKIQK